MTCKHYTGNKDCPCALWDVIRYCRQATMTEDEIDEANLELPDCYVQDRSNQIMEAEK